MRAFEYARADTLEDAVASLDHDGEARLLAGGTDLLPLMKADIASPARLIDVKRVTGLGGVITDRGSDGLEIGALTPLAALERNPLVRERYTVLAEAAGLAATPQLRNMATLGGNLLQRPRCWYYRSSLFHCWLKGGDTCQAAAGENQHHAIFQDSPCVAVHPSDPATALLALDASVRLRARSGERTVSLAEFFTLPSETHRRETMLADDELITAVLVPTLPSGAHSTYLKAMNRQVWSFALASVAASLRVEDGRIAEARLALGGVAPIPRRAQSAEQVLVGSDPSEALFERAADEALEAAQPLEHNAYKLALVRGLILHALRALAGAG